MNFCETIIRGSLLIGIDGSVLISGGALSTKSLIGTFWSMPLLTAAAMCAICSPPACSA